MTAGRVPLADIIRPLPFILTTGSPDETLLDVSSRQHLPCAVEHANVAASVPALMLKDELDHLYRPEMVCRPSLTAVSRRMSKVRASHAT
jgi:hypothetical protein